MSTDGISDESACSGIVLFHYLAGDKDATDDINGRLNVIRKATPNTPIYVIILCDPSKKSQQLKINTDMITAPPQSFIIYPVYIWTTTLNLYFEKPKSWTQQRYSGVLPNWESLKSHLKAIHIPRN